MDRTKMIQVVQRIFLGDGSEEEINHLLHSLINALPNANVSDMIYYPDQRRSAEELVDEALRRNVSKIIRL